MSGTSKRAALGAAGGVIVLGAAVFGGREWGQLSASGGSVAQAAGPVTAQTQPATNWVTQVAQAVRPSVVNIEVSAGPQSRGSSGRGGISIGGSGISIGGAAPSGGAGTGILLDNQGDILTNDHVITLDGSGAAASIQVALANGKTDSATVVGEDPATDLAVIKVNAADVSGLTPITWADPNSIQVGEPVVAIGYALDLGGEPTVTSGVVSAVNREIDEQSATISGAVQTDAAINPGNSGGPLLNDQGQVIGINTAGLEGTASVPAQGINFAISVQTAKSVSEALIKDGKVDRGYMGITVATVTPQDAQANGLPVSQGAGIEQVTSGSPAAQAGLQAGDVIVKVGDVTITNTGDLSTALMQYGPGTKVPVTFYRGSSQQTVQLTLGSRSS
jgi:putative serine protease PepD